MNMFTDNRRNRNNKSPKGFAIAVAVIALLQIISAAEVSGGGVFLIAFLVPVLAIAIFFFAFKAISKSTVKSKAEDRPKRSNDEYCKTCSDEFVYNNRQVEYNEFSAEEHFVRDRQRRLRQLDEFLKNGLIDKNEYMVLRSHYNK